MLWQNKKSFLKRGMDPVRLSLTAAAAAAAAALSCELLHHTRTVTEMTRLSPRTTFSALELNNKKGLLNQSAPCTLLFRLHRLHVVFAAFLHRCSDYKQIKHGNWKNNWTFLLAEDGGGGLSVGGRTLPRSVFYFFFGRGGWRAGGERREGGLGLGGVGVWWCEDCGLWLGKPVPRVLPGTSCFSTRRMLDWESGWACRASLWTKSGVSVALRCILLSR